MAGRRLWFSIAAASLALGLSAPARGDGTGLLDINSEEERAEMREWLSASRKKVDPSKLPPEVSRAAAESVPGLKVENAAVISHRPISSFRTTSEYCLNGRDSKGRAVCVRTGLDGSRPTVSRLVPVGEPPAAEVAEGRKYAEKHGYTLTRALVVTRTQRSALRTTTHTMYYLKGTTAREPKQEEFVWLCGKGRFWLRDLDDLIIKQMLLETE
jgi:hypothetical protein